MDEAGHIAADFRCLKTRDFRLNLAHQLRSKLLSGEPRLPIKPTAPLNTDNWNNAEKYKIGRECCNNPSSRRYLSRGWVKRHDRLNPGLGVVIASCTRKQFGIVAEVFSLALLAIGPNILTRGKSFAGLLPHYLLMVLLVWRSQAN